MTWPDPRRRWGSVASAHRLAGAERAVLGPQGAAVAERIVARARGCEPEIRDLLDLVDRIERGWSAGPRWSSPQARPRPLALWQGWLVLACYPVLICLAGVGMWHAEGGGAIGGTALIAISGAIALWLSVSSRDHVAQPPHDVGDHVGMQILSGLVIVGLTGLSLGVQGPERTGAVVMHVVVMTLAGIVALGWIARPFLGVLLARRGRRAGAAESQRHRTAGHHAGAHHAGVHRAGGRRSPTSSRGAGSAELPEVISMQAQRLGVAEPFHAAAVQAELVQRVEAAVARVLADVDEIVAAHYDRGPALRARAQAITQLGDNGLLDAATVAQAMTIPLGHLLVYGELARPR